MLRMIAAIALMIGFYVLAFGMVWLAFVRPGFFTVVAGAVVLWSILPRFDKFVPPGPRLTPESQPELFALVREVAAATAEAMPSEVYLAGDVNAFVAHRGGLAGIGSRRVMAVGLPLLQTLTVSQLRAVIAHEFGHYAAGDLKLGALVYRTRAAMARTVENLARARSLAARLFLAYGKLFMRVTQSIARGQELAADRVAVRIAGARSHAEALRAAHAADRAFGVYWASEVVPVLSNGYRPPISAGFAQFIRAAAIAKAIEDELERDECNPYDSHPPLKERLAAIGDVVGPTDATPAISLLRDVAQLEHELLGVELTPVEWDDTPAKVFVPNWRARAAELAGACANATAADAFRLMEPVDAAVVVAATLLDEGWTCTTSPGEQIVFTKDDRSFRPFVEAARGGEEWLAAVREAGIAELPLG